MLKFGVSGIFCITVCIEDENQTIGRFQLEILGKYFGDFGYIESIGTAVAGLYDLPGENLVPSDVFLLPNNRIIDLVKDAYFGDGGIDNYFKQTGRAGGFLVLTNTLAAFDDVFLVLIENSGKGRFVWRIGEEYFDAIMDAAVYKSAIDDFVNWWEQKTTLSSAQ